MKPTEVAMISPPVEALRHYVANVPEQLAREFLVNFFMSALSYASVRSASLRPFYHAG
jgi:hypothetical protein